MLKIFSAAALLAIAGSAFAQSTQPTPSTAPSTSPGQSPTATQQPAPAVSPSQTPAVTPSQTPSVTSPAPITPPAAVGGLSRCQNMIGADRDTCLMQERAGTGSTSAGSTGAAGSSTSGTSTQPTAPIGSPTGTVR